MRVRWLHAPALAACASALVCSAALAQASGAVPPLDLFEHVSGPFKLVERWTESGEHYARTARAWLGNTDRCQKEIHRQFQRELCPAEARREMQRWRMLLMGCEEMFGSDGGTQWMVSHQLLAPR
jgi:cyclopropane-fatty-acyl-phospholipid synthase